MLVDIEVKTPEIREVFPQIKEVAKQLREPVRNREYDLVIGDDFSGRIPAMIIGWGINRYYSRNGLYGIPQRSVHKDNWRGVKDFLKNYSRGKKGLLVTESVVTGGSIREYKDICDRYGKEIDVATLTSSFDRDTYVDCYAIGEESGFFSGNIGAGHTPFYRKEHLLGIRAVQDSNGALVGKLIPYRIDNFRRAIADIEKVANKVADILSSS